MSLPQTALHLSIKLNLYTSANVKTIYRGVNLEFFNAGNSILEHNKVTFAFIGGYPIEVNTMQVVIIKVG